MVRFLTDLGVSTMSHFCLNQLVNIAREDGNRRPGTKTPGRRWIHP
jgi:hypothetical protein